MVWDKKVTCPFSLAKRDKKKTFFFQMLNSEKESLGVQQLFLSKMCKNEEGSNQTLSLSTTSCFSCQVVQSPWRPSGTRILLVCLFFKGACKAQEIGFKFLWGIQFIS